MTDDDDVVIVHYVTEIVKFDSSESVLGQPEAAHSMEVVWRALQIAEHLDEVQVPFASISRTILARRVGQYALIEKPAPGGVVFVVSHSICIPRNREAGVLEEAFEVFVDLFENMVKLASRAPVGALQTNIIEGDHGVTFSWKQRFIW